MISLVICSRTRDLNSDIKRNIEESIGSEYEWVFIDNSTSKYSIFEAYNVGINRSNGEIICFLHDDIIFHTTNWGNYLRNCFNSYPDLGLLGVAGAKIKTRMPSAWWDCPEEFKVIHIIQHKNGKKSLRFTGFREQSSEEEVAVIDGVFMAMRNNKKFFFNEKLNGFHNYDLNISLEHTINGEKIMVTKNILIEHFSSGSINENWFFTTNEIHGHYKNNLPIDKANISSKEFSKIELKNGEKFVLGLYKTGFKKKAIKTWIELFQLKPFSLFHLRILKIFFAN
jgi:glycosyltransferase involved in cell wall biosynthesis